MTSSLSGPWDQQTLDDFLSNSALPIRLSCVASDGFPRVVSLWYAYDAPCLFCATHESSSLVKLLEKNPRVGFEISPNAPPYYGVRGQATAALEPLGESDLLKRLLTRYVGDTSSPFSRWLLSRSAEELVISLTPNRLYSWDYRQRMSDIN
jgi:hypothetical protein